MAEKKSAPEAPGVATAPASITKAEAVRRALDELGMDAAAKDVHTYVLTHFGLEVSTNHVSATKSDIRKAAGKRKAAKKKAAEAVLATQAQKPVAAPVAAPAVSGGTGGKGSSILLEDILTVRRLVDSVGPDDLRTLIAAFAR